MNKIIVAFDGNDQSHDALRLAQRLAGAYEEPQLIVAATFAYELYDPLGVGTYEDQRKRFFARATERAGRLVGSDALDLRAIDAEPSRGLFELAEREDAELLVLGSSHRGKIGQFLLGSTASKMLRSAPCAIAVAPRGYGRTES